MAKYGEGIEVVRESTNARTRTIGDKTEELCTIQDFAGFDATNVFTALTNALTDGSYVKFPPGAYALTTAYTIASGKVVELAPGCVLTVDAVALTCTGTLLRYLTGSRVLANSGTTPGAGLLLTTTTNG